MIPGVNAQKTNHQKETLCQILLPTQFFFRICLKILNHFGLCICPILHGREFGGQNCLLLDSVRNLNPDLIVMSGDMVNGGQKSCDVQGRQNFLKLCRTLSTLCPVLYSLGNHELELPDSRLAVWTEKVRRTGVTVLDNQSIDIMHDTVRFPVFGLTMPLLYYKDPLKKPYNRKANWTCKDMERIFGSLSVSNSKSAGPSILLAHNPLYFPAYRDGALPLLFQVMSMVELYAFL